MTPHTMVTNRGRGLPPLAPSASRGHQSLMPALGPSSSRGKAITFSRKREKEINSYLVVQFIICGS